MRTFTTEEAKAARALSPGRMGHIDPAKAATEHPTVRDIAWAAGIFEGEGCPFKSSVNAAFAGVTQKERWLPDRMRALFGGSVRQTFRKESWRTLSPQGASYWHWNVSGARARGFLMTVYPFLSPRRKEQIKWVLGHQTKEQYLANVA